MKDRHAINHVLDEYARATDAFGPFASMHEGYAVLLEELDELWDEIKSSPNKNPMRAERIRLEAGQVAAMALRFLVDCCDEASS